MSTKIEWAEETWNPIIGCSHASPGCDHCYAERMAGRLSNIPAQYENYSKVVRWGQHPKTDMYYGLGQWNGETHLVEFAIQKPFHWKKPRRIFICSMGDLFHETVPFEWIDKVMVWATIATQHTFMVLTKRPERMKEYFSREREEIADGLEKACYDIGISFDDDPDSAACYVWNRINGVTAKETTGWPLTNLWIGVTAENQEQADKRIPILQHIPAAKRFVSIEPMLGPVDLIKNGDILCRCEGCMPWLSKRHGSHDYKY